MSRQTGMPRPIARCSRAWPADFAPAILGLKIAGCASAAGQPDQYSKNVSVYEGLADLYDILNVHTYSMIEGYPTWRRVWPEHEGIAYLKVVQEMLAWRDVNAPGKQVWLTEFGYDAGTGKTGSGDFAHWVGSTETEQAQWTVRSFLAFSALGVDRAYLYFFDDKDEPMLHGSSGITRNFVPKPAYYAMAHLYQTLGDYRFSRVIANEKETLCAYEYLCPGKPAIRVVWSPTGTQREAVMQLPLNGKVTRAETMPFKPGAAPVPAITAVPGGIKLKVSESPTYLWID